MLDRVITKYQTKDEEAKIKWIKQSDILKQFLPLCSIFFFFYIQSFREQQMVLALLFKWGVLTI